MTVTTFPVLGQWASAFAVGEFPSMIVVGQAGLSKTTSFIHALEDALGDSEEPLGAEWLYVSARLSAFELFRQAYLFKDKPILIDDVDSLLADRQTVALLKALLQDHLPRRVTWFSQAAGEDRDTPASFFTSSPICIVANDIGTVSANLSAVLDRCQLIEFRPSVREVLSQVAGWFHDEEVLEFVHRWEPFIFDGKLTMRQLKRAHGLRVSTRVQVDWQAELLDQWGISPALLAAARVRANTGLKSRAAKAAEFKRLCGGCAALMYKKIAELDCAKVKA